MTNKPENPPAFPVACPELGGGIIEGMTLRDFMAAAALQGLISHIGCSPEDKMETSEGVTLEKTAAESISESCYKYADAMLIARGK